MTRKLDAIVIDCVCSHGAIYYLLFAFHLCILLTKAFNKKSN